MMKFLKLQRKKSQNCSRCQCISSHHRFSNSKLQMKWRYLMVDMAHIAGLVAAGLHQSCEYAHFVTTTTHKTLREREERFWQRTKQIDKAISRYARWTPMHIIAGKAVCFKEASTDAFQAYRSKLLECCNIS